MNVCQDGRCSKILFRLFVEPFDNFLAFHHVWIGRASGRSRSITHCVNHCLKRAPQSKSTRVDRSCQLQASESRAAVFVLFNGNVGVHNLGSCNCLQTVATNATGNLGKRRNSRTIGL